MKLMNKLGLLILIVLVALTAISCQNTKKNGADKVTVRAATPAGPAGIAFVNLIESHNSGLADNKYDILITASPDEIAAKVISGEIDVAAVPPNLAATLYNRLGGGVRVLSLYTTGILYILENGEAVSRIEDLRGKTLYATGKGSMPEYALSYILRQNGLEPGVDVIIEYKTEHAELASLMAAGEVTLGMLPEPFVTTTMMRNSNLRVALNLTDEWKSAAKNAGAEDSVMVMGCIIARTEFADEHPDELLAFMKEFKKSAESASQDVNGTAVLCEVYEILPSSSVAMAAIPKCNIVYIDGQTMIDKTKNLFDVLFEADPKSLGGTLPDDSIFYKSK